MYCQRCGTQLPETAIACFNCGLHFTSSSLPTMPYVPPVSAQTVAASNPPPVVVVQRGNYGAIIGGIAILVLIGVIGFGIFGALFIDREKVSNVFEQQKFDVPSTSSQKTNTPQTLFDESKEVPARSHFYKQFTLNRSAKLTGDFNVTGGSNDIDVYVMTNEEFENFADGKSFRTFFRRKGASNASMSVNLDSGNYTIVFDNSGALLTNKIVKAKFQIE